MSEAGNKPIIIITGAGGNLGRSLGEALAPDYRIVGLDIEAEDADFPILAVDFTSDAAVELALRKFRDTYGTKIACVIHLVAYFDFSGEDNPRYRTVNVEGTARLLRALQDFDVERFIYASSMLVHAPCRPGERINEQQPLDPHWVYPQSKADAEAAIRAEHEKIPYTILRLAGIYDERSMVPTMAQQMARIYERDVQSHFYSGNTLVGQAMLHRADMLDALRRSVDRRATLPPAAEILIGEADAVGYEALQDELGKLIHGEEEWTTLRLPKTIAAAGAWAQGKLEPAIPDQIDDGKAPFIKPFMVDMADDHYALDTALAEKLLGWKAQHRLKEELPHMVAALKQDPAGWYRTNRVSPPVWLAQADAVDENPEALRAQYETQIRQQHRDHRWAHFINMGLATWLITQPLLINVEEPWLRWSEIVLGLMLLAGAALALSWRAQWARWLCAGIGMLVMAIPFLFSTANAAAYLSDTLVGALIFGFAVCTRPEPGPSALAALTGPVIPPGWSYNPSAMSQRVPIILLAFLGLYVSRYLAAYQLDYIPGVWDPFFDGAADDPQNGTEEIITSWVSEAWPVSDAAVGGYTYVLEILTGIVGSRMRWRTMPWLVLLFGLMIAPLGITSIFFIIIQPVLLDTWSIIALIGAAAVLIQIPYSLDELLATAQFLRRRVQAGQHWLHVLIKGDTDDMPQRQAAKPEVTDGDDEFDQPPATIIKQMFAGGVSLPWNLALAAVIGLALLFTRVLIGADGSIADAHHVIGSLLLTVISLAAAEVARPLRYLMIPLALALMAAPFIWHADLPATAVSITLGAVLIALSLRRGGIRERYGKWTRLIV